MCVRALEVSHARLGPTIRKLNRQDAKDAKER